MAFCVLVYVERMARAATPHKNTYGWFDCWGIGKLVAMHAHRVGDMPTFYRGRSMVEEPLRMHIAAEPEDLAMRAKVHD